MADKNYSQFTAGTPANTDITLYADPSTGSLKKVSIAALLATQVEQDPMLTGVQLLGSNYKGLVLNQPVQGVSNGWALTSGRADFYMITLPACTVTGAFWAILNGGTNVVVNFNGLSLYSISGGTLNQIAKTASNGNYWDNGAGVFHSTAFTSTVNVNAGVYVLAILAKTSSGSNMPGMMSTTWNMPAATLSAGMSNSLKLACAISGQTDLLTSYTASALGAIGQPIPYMGVY